MSGVNGYPLLSFLLCLRGLTSVGKLQQLLLPTCLEACFIFNEHLESCSREWRMGGSEISFAGIHKNTFGTNLPDFFFLQFGREDFQKYLVGSKRISNQVFYDSMNIDCLKPVVFVSLSHLKNI